MKVINPINVETNFCSHSRASTGTFVNALGGFSESAVNTLRFNYNKRTGDYEGPLIEPERTNIFLNTGTVSSPTNINTQLTINISSFYAGFVISFYGDGSMSIDGTNYTKEVQGTHVNERVYYSVKRTTDGTFSFTPSGTIYAVNVEPIRAILPGTSPIASSFTEEELNAVVRPTSWIPTGGAPVTRSADVLDGYGIIKSNFIEIYDTYVATTTYTEGEIVVHEAREYEYVSGTPTSGNTPSSSSIYWTDLGASNTYSMFDLITDKASTADTAREVAVRIEGRASAAAFADIQCRTLEFTAHSSGDGIFLGDTNEDSFGATYYHNYETDIEVTSIYYDGFENADIISFAMTPYVIDSVVQPMSLGRFVTGPSKEIGKTQYGMSAGIIDYSKKETNDLGVTSFVERSFSKRLNAKVETQNVDMNEVSRFLYDVRAKPTAWLGTDEANLSEISVLFGFLKDFDILVSYPEQSIISIQIEGLSQS